PSPLVQIDFSLPASFIEANTWLKTSSGMAIVTSLPTATIWGTVGVLAVVTDGPGVAGTSGSTDVVVNAAPKTIERPPSWMVTSIGPGVKLQKPAWDTLFGSTFMFPRPIASGLLALRASKKFSSKSKPRPRKSTNRSLPSTSPKVNTSTAKATIASKASQMSAPQHSIPTSGEPTSGL